MKNDYKITTCGLNCDLCDANTTKIQDTANYLLEVFKDPMFTGIISMTNQDFKPENIPAFKEVLKVLTQYPACPGCEGRKDCTINMCANKKSIEDCSSCNYLDAEKGICSATPGPPEVPFMPPAPLFFNGLTQRYKKWNIKNLESIKKGKKEEINKEIEEMINKGKTSRDLIDTSINLFDQMMRDKL
ncbi:MAG: DUF3795 domain-containing protein [Promethearchaeota archaeon]